MNNCERKILWELETKIVDVAPLVIAGSDQLEGKMGISFVIIPLSLIS